jgi:hypothetical protein
MAKKKASNPGSKAAAKAAKKAKAASKVEKKEKKKVFPDQGDDLEGILDQVCFSSTDWLSPLERCSRLQLM